MESQPVRQVDDSEFLDIAHDPAEARVVRKALEQIAGGGAGEAMKEMAQEILSGRIGIRQAVQVSAYSDAMAEKGQEFREQWDALSQRERDERVAQGEKFLEEQRHEIDEERREMQRQHSGSKMRARHSAENWSL